VSPSPSARQSIGAGVREEFSRSLPPDACCRVTQAGSAASCGGLLRQTAWAGGLLLRQPPTTTGWVGGLLLRPPTASGLGGWPPAATRKAAG
jgi:hypothetical protein